jgi:hypothetical protein
MEKLCHNLLAVSPRQSSVAGTTEFWRPLQELVIPVERREGFRRGFAILLLLPFAGEVLIGTLSEDYPWVQ